MLGYVFIFGLLIGTFYWILHPLLKEDDRQNDFTPKPEDILEKLRQKKDDAYAAIHELEFDLSMGKLTKEDFQMLKRQYLQEAAGYMKEMDQLEISQTTISKVTETNLEKENEKEVTATRTPESAKRRYIYCTSCGRKAAVESRFCAACGSNLHKHGGEK
ncbi:MAG: hypothetical protein JSW26_22915 [Desulfobacterales bacterium]|nr:MAG: hypothetical protein JSW26_22915 [Desulfobacterales bacterium]